MRGFVAAAVQMRAQPGARARNRAVAEKHVRMSVKAMTARSAILRTLIDEGRIMVVGAMEDVGTGRVTFMEPAPGNE